MRARMMVCLVATLSVLGPSGCGLFPTGGDDRDGVGGGGTDGDWQLVHVPGGQYEPGEWLTLHVDGIRRADGAPMLWIGDADDLKIVFPAAQRRADPDEADAGARLLDDAEAADLDAGVPLADAGADDEPARYELQIPIPLWNPGTYTLTAGTLDERKTRSFDIEVVLPERRMPQAEAGALLRDGLRAVVGDFRELFEDPDPEWQALVAQQLDASERAELMDALAAVETAADQAAAEYMSVPPEDEQILQGALFNAGVFPSLQSVMAADGASSMTLLALPPRLEMAIHRPLHALLYGLDLMDALLTSVGLALDVVEIASALVGALPATAACVGTKVVLGTVRALIENFVPTDLLAIELHGQRRLYHGEGATFLHWGRFGPQNAGGSTVRSIEDVVLTAVGELIPGVDGRGAKAFLRMVASYFAMRVPGAIIEQGIGGEVRFTGVLLPLDMNAYNVRLSQALAFLPVGGWLATSATYLISDPELISPIELVGYSPTWARDARVRVDYHRDVVSVLGIDYPTGGTETASVAITSTGYRFTTENSYFGLTSIPWIEGVEGESGRIAVQGAPDRFDRNAAVSDETWIITRIDLPDGTSQQWVGRDTPTTRVYPMQFEDLTGSSAHVALVTILVNGAAQFTDLDINQIRSANLVLQPGLNTLTIVAGDTDDLPCDGSRILCAEFTMPDVVNLDKGKDLFMNLGESHDLQVWTPPVFE